MPNFVSLVNFVLLFKDFYQCLSAGFFDNLAESVQVKSDTAKFSIHFYLKGLSREVDFSKILTKIYRTRPK